MINHSSLLLQLEGMNILTDPIWSERASPFTWVGPRRHRPPGVQWDDLPPIDMVLVSHNHYDHLDLPTLRRLTDRGRPEFVVPIGVAALLRSRNIAPAYELDWGDSLPLAGATIHAVPAVHFSGRTFSDRNRTLWCGFLIQAAGRVVYFAGDTAFGDHFAEIRQRFGEPHLALLPAGAYDPSWFMAPVHMNPMEALRAHRVLAAHTSIAIHCGTFQLADESIDEPKRILQTAATDPSFLVLNNGQFVTL